MRHTAPNLAWFVVAVSAVPNRGQLKSSLRTLTFLVLCLALLAWPTVPARAQSAQGTLNLTAVETTAFPTLNAYLSVTDADGRRVAGLKAEDFTLLENTAPVSGLAVSEEEVGLQVVFVLDTSAAFKARDAAGVTRLEHLQSALTDFVQTTPGMKNGVDDVTVLTPERLIIGHSSNGREIAPALAAYTTEFAGAADPSTLINAGLDFASEANARPGMRRYLVLLSNGFTFAKASGSLDDVVTRAAAAGVEIHTVFVGPEGSEEIVEAQNLRQLSERTGGAAFVFSNEPRLTSLFETLSDQRTQYRLSYRSTIAATGQHTLAARVRLPGGAELTSAEKVFPLRVAAPTVTVRDLPTTIQRVMQGDTATPVSYTVPVAVDFPDGQPRNLGFAQLLVDGQIVDTQQAPSVAGLTWPLEAYTTSGPHAVEVRIADELGLAAESETLTVNVVVETRAVSTAPAASESEPLNWGLIVAIGLGALALAGASVGGWMMFTRWRTARLAHAETLPPSEVPKRVASAPLSTPKTSLKTTRPLTLPPKPRSAPRFSLPRGVRQPSQVELPVSSQACLEVLEPGGGGAPRAPIEISTPSLRLGRDGALAEVVFHDRSVSRLHARLEEVAEGVYRLYDEKSTSGTWVNFTPVPAEGGLELKHGDVINLGRVQLKFVRRDASADPKANGARVVKVTEAAPGPTEPHPPAQR